jgi:hypothetical protein
MGVNCSNCNCNFNEEGSEIVDFTANYKGKRNNSLAIKTKKLE